MSKRSNKEKRPLLMIKNDIETDHHMVQIIYEITTADTEKNGRKAKREYNSKAFKAYGGKQQVYKAIETKSKDISEQLDNSYDWELIDFQIKRIFIDGIKKD